MLTNGYGLCFAKSMHGNMLVGVHVGDKQFVTLAGRIKHSQVKNDKFQGRNQDFNLGGAQLESEVVVIRGEATHGKLCWP